MGTYLYGVKKLKKAQLITREDGATVTVTHTLVYRMKPSFGWGGRLEQQERFIIGGLESNHPNGFKGVLLFGETVYLWDGAPYWYDSGKMPATAWGVVTDLRGDEDYKTPEKAKASKARLPALVLTGVDRLDSDGVTRKMEVRLQQELHILNPERRVVAAQSVYAVKKASGEVEFRGAGFAPVMPCHATDVNGIYRDWQQFCRVASDWLEENRPASAEVA